MKNLFRNNWVSLALVAFGIYLLVMNIVTGVQWWMYVLVAIVIFANGLLAVVQFYENKGDTFRVKPIKVTEGHIAADGTPCTKTKRFFSTNKAADYMMMRMMESAKKNPDVGGEIFVGDEKVGDIQPLNEGGKYVPLEEKN